MLLDLYVFWSAFGRFNNGLAGGGGGGKVFFYLVTALFEVVLQLMPGTGISGSSGRLVRSLWSFNEFSKTPDLNWILSRT